MPTDRSPCGRPNEATYLPQIHEQLFYVSSGTQKGRPSFPAGSLQRSQSFSPRRPGCGRAWQQVSRTPLVGLTFPFGHLLPEGFKRMKPPPCGLFSVPGTSATVAPSCKIKSSLLAVACGNDRAAGNESSNHRKRHCVGTSASPLRPLLLRVASAERACPGVAWP